MIAGRKFHFRPVLTICAGLALVVLLALGNWQVQRLDWKRELIAGVEARISASPIPFEDAVRRAESGAAMDYAPVYFEGTIDRQSRALVFGTFESEVGAYVFSPATDAAGTAIYVNEGFVPQKIIPELEARQTSERIVGLLRQAEELATPASLFRPRGKSADGTWFVRDPVAFGVDAGVQSSPYYIDRYAVDGREWPKGGTTRIDFRNKHLEYALTWFGLAGALVAVWVAMSLQPRD